MAKYDPTYKENVKRMLDWYGIDIDSEIYCCVSIKDGEPVISINTNPHFLIF